MDNRRPSSNYTYSSNNSQSWAAPIPGVVPAHAIHRTSESYGHSNHPRTHPPHAQPLHPSLNHEHYNHYPFPPKAAPAPSYFPSPQLPLPVTPDRQVYPQYPSHPYPTSPNHMHNAQYIQQVPQYMPQRQPDEIQYPASPHRPFPCDMCPLSFNRQHDLKRHRETHSGDKPFLCEECGKSFTRKDALKRHQTVKKCGNQKPE